MASTVAHALCGVTCVLAARAAYFDSWDQVRLRDMIAFALLASLPDVDFVVGYILRGDAHAFHQGVTHSLLFAAATGLVFALVCRRDRPLAPFAALAALTISSHGVVDLLTGPNPGFNPSPGLPLLWPFQSGLVSAPVTVFLGIEHQSIDRLLSAHNVQAVLRELVILLPIVALACLIGSGTGKRDP
jgi:inner membrane protein